MSSLDIGQYLNLMLDNISAANSYQNDFFTVEQLKVYGKKNSIGSTSYLYQTGLDQLFPTNNPISNQNYINFNGFSQYKTVKQCNTIVTGSWTPDTNIFSNEAIATPEYSAWIGEPFNNVNYLNDRYNRINYPYQYRSLPLQNSGSTYTPINDFTSGFWISLASNATTISTGSVSVIVNKSFFIESRFSDAEKLPSDASIYASSSLVSALTGSTWSSLNLSYYAPLIKVNFTLYPYDANHFNIVLDVPYSIFTGSYNHFLCLVGSSSPISNNKSVNLLTGSVSSKFSILRYLSDTYYQTIVLPKTYSTQNIKGILNTNNNTYGLTGSITFGDIVLLINQNYTGSNGLYIANSGPWLKIDNTLAKQFNFLQSTTSNLTGSKIVYAKNGICFDAIDPSMQIFSYNNDSYNQFSIYNQFQSKSIAAFSYSGPIYDSFKFDNYSFDINQPVPAASATLKFGYNDFNITITNPYITSYSPSICRIPDILITEGSISSVSGYYPIQSDSVFYAISTPADFAVCKAISNNGSVLNFIVQKVFGSPSKDLKVYSNVVIYGLNGNTFNENYNYIKMHEVFECQLFDSLDFSKFAKKGGDDSLTINNINNVANGSTGLEVKSSAINPNAVLMLAKKYGRKTTGSIFQNFLQLSIKKSFNNPASEGVIISPVNTFLSDDLQYLDKIYEYQKQLAPINGKSTFVTNSITNTSLGWQEFDFNYLNNQSISGESSSFYSAINPYFTGPNVVTSSDSFSTRINTIYNYGNKYNIIETTNNFAPTSTNAIFSSFGINQGVLGPTILNNNKTFWSSYTGSQTNGQYLTSSILGLDYPTDPILETFSSSTNFNINSSTGSPIDLIFSGQTIFIPLPVQDYVGNLQSARLAMKVLGEDAVNGFMRAFIVDMSSFFLTSDTYSVKILSSSDTVSLNFLNNTYQDVYFSFKTDALFKSRSVYGQMVYLAVQKVGDISSSIISLKSVNNFSNSIYQSYSGSNLYTNLQYSSAAQSTTGSAIFALYEYLGNPISMSSRGYYPYTQGFDIVTFPNFDNSSLTIYNSPVDNVPVTYTNSTGSISLTGISLSTPLGITPYSFITPNITGPSLIVLGSSTPTIFNTKPIGYHFLISVTKQINDGLPNALQELERNFVYDTQMSPELSLIITNRGGLNAGKNLGPDDAGLINASKSSILNYSPLMQRKDFMTNGSLYSFFTPRTSSTGSMDIFAGIRSQQIIDQVFQNNNSQTIVRSRINPTPGMSATIYEGNANGIPLNLINSIPVAEYPIASSVINASTISAYPLLLTVAYINFIATGNESSIRMTVGSNSLYRIDNLTSSTTTEGNGPTGTLSITTSSGSQYNFAVYAFGPAVEQNNIKIEYYDVAYNLFTTSNTSKFPATIQTSYVVNPYNMNLTDVFINEINDAKDDIYRRYIR